MLCVSSLSAGFSVGKIARKERVWGVYMAEMKAAEQRTVEEIIADLPQKVEYAKVKFRRMHRVADFPEGATVLDIGAAQGMFVVACEKLGYRGFGIEPWDEARNNAARLSEHLAMPVNVVSGFAEDIPFDDDTFDVVHANSVIEHVANLDNSLSEIFRVLKPGGVFWFNSASALCPIQNEISGFPLFGWYPNSLKIRIMNWAKDHRPELVGYTRAPAVHWFTPRKARRLLKSHGFSKVFDRWDLRRESEGGTIYKYLLRFIRRSIVAKTIADVMVPGCSFAAIK